ncbi:hypothetical protein Hypma_010025 [Hypsizygus marmoreus]|uniref:DH domain-containing protein n=1 Tax=Hypsizygus marmoreus TaxID=39966 RepID=A0A369JVM0_HYPMA|nr:hypothetical protein Hypma_010025 [Hypsizygus marmoreus]
MSSRNYAAGASVTHGTSPTSMESPRRFTISGFLPLPPITASPMCTPTPSLSPENPLAAESLSFKSLEEYTTAPSSPSSVPQRISTTPTWISTPPTPPPRTARRSPTCLTRPSSPLSPSASFPASTSPHETGYLLKRCASVPSMSERSRADTHLLPKRPHSRDSYHALGAIASPLNATFVTPSADAPKRGRGLKPIFHIPLEICTDTDDASPRLTESPERMNDDSVEGSSTDNDSDDTWHSEKAKDDIRKYHALRELLETEVGYLLDLRALVTVYLRILPTLICRTPVPTPFSRASSSFTSSPWINSHSHLHGSLPSSSTTLSDSSAPQSINSTTKSAPRYLFTNQEVEALTRNAEEVLQLHEHFVRELRIEMAPLGFEMPAHERLEESQLYQKRQKKALQNTDAAIRAVSTKFATESFCTGHPEALDLVRRVQSQHPLEWDAFEQRCSSLVYELELSPASTPENPDPAVASEEPDTPLSPGGLTKDRSRAASLSSIEGAVRTLRSRASNLSPRDLVAFPTESPRKDKSGPRLALLDYMIKPVQRICKYPLILDQLKTGKPQGALPSAHLRSDVDVVVESATQAMRHVASSVDEARHRQDVAIQSALIASRITFSSPAIAQMSSLYPAFQGLTPSFLSSLGTCLLAGSLDVIHTHAVRPSTSNITAKYLGAFLYLGGYLILVKVSKGKVYEPKHWFCLADFDICDIGEDDAMLPCSIGLSSKDHRFDLAAACQREKDAWLSSIQESRKHKASWINEPTSSLRFDRKGEFIPSPSDDGLPELAKALPTIKSIPELISNSEYPELTESLFTAFGAEIKQRRSLMHDSPWKPDPDPPSRHSSTTSVKAIFSPMPPDSETIIIRRASASARLRVDQGLQDVISQPCVTARSYAGIQDEELFQAPKSTRAGFVRSQSGLSMANMAKSRLTRHESVRVLRRKSLMESSDVGSSKKASSTGQSLTSRRQSRNLSFTALSDADHRTSLPSPSSFSSSGLSTPTLQTPGPSPKNPVHTPTAPGPVSAILRPSHPTPEVRSPMKTPRSLVSNVKGLFQSRSSSAVALSSPTQGPDTKIRTPSSIRRWARGTLHRRSRSAPSVPKEPVTLPDMQKLPALDFGAPISLSRTSDTIFDSQLPQSLHSNNPSRRKSLLSTSPFYQHTVDTDSDHGPTKHMTFLRRLKA